MPTDLLRDAQVRNAQPRAKPYKLADGGGLFLLVQPTGARLWRFKFRLEGKEGLLALGRYGAKPAGESEQQARHRRGAGELTLAEARDARDQARALVKQGINPVHHRQSKKRENLAQAAAQRREAEGAFGKVAAAWLEHGCDRKGRRWAAGTYRAKKARVDRFLVPIADIPVSKVSADDIRAVLDAARQGGAWSATHVKGDLSAIFDFAVAQGLAETNPIPGLRSLAVAPESESKAVLKPEQIREFYTGLNAYRGFPETALCLRLIALTACRPGEAASAEWSEFDLDAGLWRRAADKMKARREHVSPLSTQAVELLREIHAITGKGRYLFPHRTKETHTTPARLAYAMRDLNLGKGASPHCWRTTFSTWANESGFRPDAIERQLAHVEANRVRATYNKALLIDERRQLMQAWADYLDGLRQGANVTPLRGAVA